MSRAPSRSRSQSSGPRKQSREIIGPPSPATLLGAPASLVLIVLLGSFGAIGYPGDHGAFIEHMAILGVASWVLISGMTMRIETTGTELHLVNWFTVVSLLRTEIQRVDARNGVTVHTRNGIRCTAGAYGTSQLQNVIKSRRYARVAEAIMVWAEGAPEDPNRHSDSWEANPGHHRSRGRHRYQKAPKVPRHMLTVGLPVCLSVAQVLGLVLWHYSESLHQWLYGS